MIKFAYYPGCSSTGTSADYEKSTQAVCRAMGLELQPVAGWNCCGSTPAHATDTQLSAALCVRNLDLAASAGAEKLVTTCPSCLSNLRHAAHRMEDADFRQSVDELLDVPSAKVFPEATSLMQVLWDNYGADGISRRSGMKLTGLKLAPYYGCLMSRPADIMNFGDPENPTMMESILEACGAEVLDFPMKTDCCGASFGIPERPMTAKLSGRILKTAQDMGADALIVACPLCQMNLDLRQKQAAKAMNAHFQIPVLYFTQAMGLAFGYPPEDLGFEKLCASPESMLRKWAAARAAKAAELAASAKVKQASPSAEVKS